MTVRSSCSVWTASTVAVLLLGGCMVAKRPAPVVERAPDSARIGPKPAPTGLAGTTPSTASVPASESYVVKRGDTLLGIALQHGLDYRDLARWNALPNPNAIEVGQVLRVRDPDAKVLAARPPLDPQTGEAVATPYHAAPPTTGRAVATEEIRAAPLSAPESASEPGVLTGPKAVKLPYSQAALASLQGPKDTRPTPPPAPSAPDTDAARAGDDADSVTWSWPTKGKIVANFNENGGPKGVQIAGALGQPVLASAAGRVVYTGSGLRGYGNLVIIKHNNTFLSAYAHNRQILVKQGDSVTRGQRIAEMGDSDASQVMLHFEIRREGKPVDPVKFLPPG